MKYAIIQSGGNQYRVTEGEELVIDRLKGTAKQHVFTDVLLLRTDDDTVVGTPYIPNTKVTATILGEEKGEKLHVMRFKAKVRERKTIGFRPVYTKVHIDAIDTGDAKKAVSDAPTAQKPNAESKRKTAVKPAVSKSRTGAKKKA